MKNKRIKAILEFISAIAIILVIFLLIYFIFFYNKSSIIQSSSTHPYTTISGTNPQVTITNPTNSQKSAQVTIYNPTISQTKPQATISNPIITQLTVKSPITFNAGQTGSWTVPEGVKQATFSVAGGNGADIEISGDHEFGIGGKGALITTTLSVYPGQIYNIYVGNNGISNSGTVDSFTPIFLGGKSTVPEGFGNGGNGTFFYSSGGSLSALYLNKTPLIIAGGGGSGGYISNGKNSSLFSTSGSINSSSNGADSGNQIVNPNNDTVFSIDGSKTLAADAVGGAGGGGLVGGISSGVNFGGNAGTSLVPITPYTLELSKGSPSITISW